MKNLVKYEIIFKENTPLIEEVIIPFFIEDGIGSLEINGKKCFVYLPYEERDLFIYKIDKICKKFDIDFKLIELKTIDNSYLEKYKEVLQPVLIDNILIKPSWYNLDIIEIDPQTAFGTGHHESTKLAIKALLLIERFESLLDVGTGSGILSIVANKIGYKKIYSFDNDFEACKVAINNFKKNNFSTFNLFCGTLDNIKLEKKFDVVIANIISSVLLKFKDMLKYYVQKDGYLILSGILEEEKDIFKKNFSLNNFSVEKESFLKKWYSVILKKISNN